MLGQEGATCNHGTLILKDDICDHGMRVLEDVTCDHSEQGRERWRHQRAVRVPSLPLSEYVGNHDVTDGTYD